MSLPFRVVTLVAAFVVVVVGGYFLAVHFIYASPPTINYVPYASGGAVDVTMQTAPQTTVTNKPDWVSYFIQDPSTKKWVHTTFFEVPANTRVNITILGYDGCTPLRNPVWGRVTGTIGNVEYIDGKPVSSLNSWASCSVEHTFTVPGLGINVPVASPTTLGENNNLCGTSPCTSGPHEVVQFSFRTPAAGGNFSWQCIIPCGGGFLDGNGGPMGTPGYMGGQIEVTS